MARLDVDFDGARFGVVVTELAALQGWGLTTESVDLDVPTCHEHDENVSSLRPFQVKFLIPEDLGISWGSCKPLKANGLGSKVLKSKDLAADSGGFALFLVPGISWSAALKRGRPEANAPGRPSPCSRMFF